MESASNSAITVEQVVKAPLEKVWKFWSEPEHIKQWNNASEDWHTTSAQNDLKAGGQFLLRMEAKDGSFGFDFGGVYDEVRANEYIAYTLGDGRKVTISFSAQAMKRKLLKLSIRKIPILLKHKETAGRRSLITLRDTRKRTPVKKIIKRLSKRSQSVHFKVSFLLHCLCA